MDKKKLSFALAFLLISSLVAVRGVLATMKDPAPPAVESPVEGESVEKSAEVLVEPTPAVELGHLAADLVARHGSFDSELPVRDAFGLQGSPHPVAPGQPLAQGATNQQETVSAWPRHHVSLVLLTEGRESAVVDQSVVVVGESIAAGRVLSIAEDAIRVEAEDGGVLVYPLAGEPVEPVIETRPQDPASESEAAAQEIEANNDDQ